MPYRYKEIFANNCKAIDTAEGAVNKLVADNQHIQVSLGEQEKLESVVSHLATSMGYGMKGLKPSLVSLSRHSEFPLEPTSALDRRGPLIQFHIGRSSQPVNRLV